MLRHIRIDNFEDQGTMLSVVASVRVEGEPHINVRMQISPGTKMREVFERKRRTDDLEYSYFRIQMETEIPPAAVMRVYPRVDVVTKEVLADMVLNEKFRRSVTKEVWDGHLNPYPLDETCVMAIQEIGQNEFLGIQPKRVAPQ